MAWVTSRWKGIAADYRQAPDACQRRAWPSPNETNALDEAEMSPWHWAAPEVDR